MNITLLIMTTVLLLTFFSPFGVYYAIKLARKKEHANHKRMQNIIFMVCVLGVLALEILIRFSGGSGSLVSESKHYSTTYFTVILVSHIVVAVLTYLLWTALILLSNRKYQKALPGGFSKTHKQMGLVVFGGLIYTAITALIVYVMSLNIL